VSTDDLQFPTVRRGYIDGRWGQVHYRLAGAPGAPHKPPLLCLHLTPKSGWIFEPLLADLGIDRVAIAPDTPGYGGSDAPPSLQLADDYAREFAAVMDALHARIGGGPFDVLGYHTGSSFALALANLAGSRVRRVVLVSLADFSPEERRERLERLDFEFPLRPDGSHVAAQWGLIGKGVDPRLGTEWRHQSLSENLRSGRRIWWAYNAVHRHDLRGALGQLRQPALIINPQDDLWDKTRRMAAAHPQFAYAELPGAGHGVFHAERQKTSQLVRDFLDAPAA
jgi:pimeloyl-ACP methyl ester carboxylesterase